LRVGDEERLEVAAKQKGFVGISDYVRTKRRLSMVLTPDPLEFPYVARGAEMAIENNSDATDDGAADFVLSQ
jgi:hypothetical protein